MPAARRPTVPPTANAPIARLRKLFFGLAASRRAAWRGGCAWRGRTLMSKSSSSDSSLS